MTEVTLNDNQVTRLQNNPEVKGLIGRGLSLKVIVKDLLRMNTVQDLAMYLTKLDGRNDGGEFWLDAYWGRPGDLGEWNNAREILRMDRFPPIQDHPFINFESVKVIFPLNYNEEML